MDTSRSQRWRERRALWTDDETVIDPRAYSVDLIAHDVASAFISTHHYLPNYPAAQVAVGLFGPRGTLAGVAVFARPAVDAVVTAHTGFTDAAKGTVLARLLLLDGVPQNGESFFVARAFDVLRRERPAVEAVVSYSDPQAGHIGRVYAALSGAHRGVTKPRIVLRLNGTTVSGRTLSKIRTGEPGAAGGVDQLVRLGAPRPRLEETPAAWLARLQRERVLLRHRQDGLYAYCFELTRNARREGRGLPRLPYPKVLPRPHPMLPIFSGAPAEIDRGIAA